MIRTAHKNLAANVSNLETIVILHLDRTAYSGKQRQDNETSSNYPGL